MADNEITTKIHIKKTELSKLDKLLSGVTSDLKKLDLNNNSTICTNTNIKNEKLISTVKRPILNPLCKETIKNYLAPPLVKKTTKLEELIEKQKLKNETMTIDCCLSKDSSQNESSSQSTSSLSPELSSRTKLKLSAERHENMYKSNLPNDKLISYFKLKSIEWKNLDKNLVDSHCHFDMLFPKIKFYESSIDDYFKDFSNIYLKNFEACVNVICDPTKYSTKSNLSSYLQFYKHEKIYHSIGCHPHFADRWTNETETILYTFLTHSKIVAIGECGLDFSKKNHVNINTQIKVFESQLRLAKYTKIPIVIHCRDAEEKVYNMMIKHLDDDHKIHLHCFTGKWSTAKKYLEYFKNLCIGLTPLITYSANSNVYFKELIMNIPLDRILLETDSPYFVPRIKNFPFYDVQSSHPAFVFATAECLKELRDIPNLADILNINRKNVKNIYSF